MGHQPAAMALPRDYAHASNDSPIPARWGASLPLAVRPRPVTRPADRTAVLLVVEESSGADRDDVIDLVGPPPASRTPNLTDVAVTLEDNLPDPSPMAVIAEAAVLTDTHVSPSLNICSKGGSARDECPALLRCEKSRGLRGVVSDRPQSGRSTDMRDEPDAKRVRSRADPLLPEERKGGSDDPSAQAEEILAESDARTDDRVSPPGKPVERRHSEDTVEPTD
jgi:hypothetical protein